MAGDSGTRPVASPRDQEKRRKMTLIKNLLALPQTRGLDIDDPRTTELRGSIIRDKGFLRRVYEEWYTGIVAAMPPCEGPVLELGSGGGFLGEFIPDLITSDVFPAPGVSRVLDAHSLPFGDSTLRDRHDECVPSHLPPPTLPR